MPTAVSSRSGRRSEEVNKRYACLCYGYIMCMFFKHHRPYGSVSRRVDLIEKLLPARFIMRALVRTETWTLLTYREYSVVRRGHQQGARRHVTHGGTEGTPRECSLIRRV
ncbi:unnamed protein product [Ectocarpus sp. 12 AP-2014]